MPASVNLGSAHVVFTGDFGKIIAGLRLVDQEARTTAETTKTRSRSMSSSFAMVGRSMMMMARSANDARRAMSQMFRSMTTQMVFVQLDIGHIADQLRYMGMLAGAAFGGMTSASLSFQQSFVGLRKTVDASESEFRQIERNIRMMSTQIAVGANDLNELAAVAGQLGIRGVDDISKFTQTVAGLGIATNVVGEKGASELARLMNIMGESTTNVDRLGSALVELGNNFATTEAEILEMSQLVAGAGRTVGLTTQEVLGLSTAMSAVGIASERGGSAISRVLIEMYNASYQGGRQLQEFARASGVSARNFARTIQTDPLRALQMFIEGLRDLDEAGKNVFRVLENVNASEIRTRDVLLRLFNASDLFTQSLEMSNRAWEENLALAKEVEEAHKPILTQFRVLWNQVVEVARGIGDHYKPAWQEVIDVGSGVLGMFSDLSEEQRTQIARWTALSTVVLGAGVAFLVVIRSLFSFMTIIPIVSRGILTVLSPAFVVFAGLMALAYRFFRSLEDDDLQAIIDKFRTSFDGLKNTLQGWVSELKESGMIQELESEFANLRAVWTDPNLDLGDTIKETGKITLRIAGVLFQHGTGFVADSLAGWVRGVLGIETAEGEDPEPITIDHWIQVAGIGVRILWEGLDNLAGQLADWLKTSESWKSFKERTVNLMDLDGDGDVSWKDVTVPLVIAWGWLVDVGESFRNWITGEGEQSGFAKLWEEIVSIWNSEFGDALKLPTTLWLVWSLRELLGFAAILPGFLRQRGFIRRGLGWAYNLGRVGLLAVMVWDLLPEEWKDLSEDFLMNLAEGIRGLNTEGMDNPFVNHIANWLESAAENPEVVAAGTLLFASLARRNPRAAGLLGLGTLLGGSVFGGWTQTIPMEIEVRADTIKTRDFLEDYGELMGVDHLEDGTAVLTYEISRMGYAVAKTISMIENLRYLFSQPISFGWPEDLFDGLIESGQKFLNLVKEIWGLLGWRKGSDPSFESQLAMIVEMINMNRLRMEQIRNQAGPNPSEEALALIAELKKHEDDLYAQYWDTWNQWQESLGNSVDSSDQLSEALDELATEVQETSMAFSGVRGLIEQGVKSRESYPGQLDDFLKVAIVLAQQESSMKPELGTGGPFQLRSLALQDLQKAGLAGESLFAEGSIVKGDLEDLIQGGLDYASIMFDRFIRHQADIEQKMKELGISASEAFSIAWVTGFQGFLNLQDLDQVITTVNGVTQTARQRIKQLAQAVKDLGIDDVFLPGFLGMSKYREGVILPGFGGGDKEPALLEAGEAVVPARTVQGGLGAIVDWFRSKGVRRYASGNLLSVPGGDSEFIQAAEGLMESLDDLTEEARSLGDFIDATSPLLDKIYGSVIGSLDFIIERTAEAAPDLSEFLTFVRDMLELFMNAIGPPERPEDEDSEETPVRDPLRTSTSWLQQQYENLIELLELWQETAVEGFLGIQEIFQGAIRAIHERDFSKFWDAFMEVGTRESTARMLSIPARAMGLYERDDGEIQILAQAKESIEAFKNSLMEVLNPMNIFEDILNRINPLGELMAGVLEPLVPVIEAILMPLRVLGEALGEALAPIMEALFPVMKELAIVATYVIEVFSLILEPVLLFGGLILEVAGTLVEVIGMAINPFAKAIGTVIEAIGSAVYAVGKALPFGLGKGLKQIGSALQSSGRAVKGFGDALIGTGRAAKAAGIAMQAMSKSMPDLAGSMATVREVIQNLQWTVSDINELFKDVGITVENLMNAIARVITSADLTQSFQAIEHEVRTGIQGTFRELIKSAIVQQFMQDVMEPQIKAVVDSVKEIFLAGDQMDFDVFKDLIESLEDPAVELAKALKEAGFAADEVSKSFKDMVLNAPEGYNVQRARFEAASQTSPMFVERIEQLLEEVPYQNRRPQIIITGNSIYGPDDLIEYLREAGALIDTEFDLLVSGGTPERGTI